MKYTDIPKPWKQRISGSINFYITAGENNIDLITNMWIKNRIIEKDGRKYFQTSDLFASDRFELDDELYIELISLLKERFLRRKSE